MVKELRNDYLEGYHTLTLDGVVREVGFRENCVSLEKINDEGETYTVYECDLYGIENVYACYYKDLLVSLIRLKYDVNDEIALIKKNGTEEQSEYDAYQSYVIYCKEYAKTIYPEN